MAVRVLGLAFRDLWQELWTILIVNLLFLFANVLILPGPPATLALFYYGNRIAHGETATERDFLQAIRSYWKPAWRWGLINLLVIGLLTGDYYLIERLIPNPEAAALIRGLYVTLMITWLVIQLFTPPFLFEQEQPSVRQALRNAVVFIRKNLLFSLTLALLLALSLILGILAFMLTLAFGGTLVAFASNHAVLQELTDR
ncbi:MAG TPA: DUF624 domain-containing protein [Anaerolineales bacterium]|nr:DUF624 domain-containing protein [Anaerolineales bacterium]